MLASKEANEYLENYHSKQLENSQISVVAYALPEPMQMLEKALGVRFFENLRRVAAKRLATMDDATASIYGLWLMQGIGGRHPLLEKDFCEWFMIEICGQYGSVKGKNLISDVKLRSFYSFSSTSVFWLFRTKL